jgi:ribonuclease HII
MSGLLLCGVDEAGRGPLAGAVFAAAVILDPAHPIAGLADSKKLSEARRDALAIEIRQHALAWSIATASVAEIDQINILQASLLAMSRAVAGLSVRPDKVEVDGNRVPTLTIAVPVEAIVKGDAKVAAISAASILAKTARDAELVALDAEWPCYGFAQHKGYPTAAHLAALAQFGASPVHRQSFGPVKRLLAQGRLFG